MEGSNFYAFLHNLGHTVRREDDIQFHLPAQQGLEMSSVFPVTASQCEMYRTALSQYGIDVVMSD